jgi:hypothetical protein
LQHFTDPPTNDSSGATKVNCWAQAMAKDPRQAGRVINISDNLRPFVMEFPAFFKSIFKACKSSTNRNLIRYVRLAETTQSGAVENLGCPEAPGCCWSSAWSSLPWVAEIVLRTLIWCWGDWRIDQWYTLW